MTKREAVREFTKTIRPAVLLTYGQRDKPAMREAWNDYTDRLRKENRISAKQYETWIGPVK